MAVVLINTILTGVLIFVIVPASNRTVRLVDKVASIVDLELEDPQEGDIKVTDITGFDITDEMTINLQASKDGSAHYARINTVTISMNNKHKDYKELSEKMTENVTRMKEIIVEEIGKYSADNVLYNKEAIKEAVLTRLQELFHSDFIIYISFGDMVLS
jgi:flagellar FliL protein